MWPEAQDTQELIFDAKGGKDAAVERLLDRHRDALRRLVDHSLVQFDPHAGRYRILEPVRRDSLARRRHRPAGPRAP